MANHSLNVGDPLYKYSFHSAGYFQCEQFVIEDIVDGKLKCRPVAGRSKMFMDSKDVDERIFHVSRVKGVILSEKDKARACEMLIDYLEKKMREYLAKLDGYSNLYDLIKKEREMIG